MGEQKPEKTKKHICAGLLAHVCAEMSARSEDLFYLQIASDMAKALLP